MSVGMLPVPIPTATATTWESEAQAAAVAAAEAIAAAAAADVAAEAAATAEAAVIVANAAAERATAKASQVAAQAQRAAASAATNIATRAAQLDPDVPRGRDAAVPVPAALPADPEVADCAQAASVAASIATAKVADAVFAAAAAAADAVFQAAAVAATAVLEAEALIEVQLTHGVGVAPPSAGERTDATHLASAMAASRFEVRDAMSRRQGLGGLVTVAHGLEQLLRMHGEGASVNTIAAALNAGGYRRADGTRWHRSSVTIVIGAFDS
jgi:hypothetical protein